MSNQKKIEPKCKYCWDKKFSTVLVSEGVVKIPCKRCQLQPKEKPSGECEKKKEQLNKHKFLFSNRPSRGHKAFWKCFRCNNVVYAKTFEDANEQGEKLECISPTPKDEGWWKEEFKEDFKRKDWTSEDWKNSKDSVDRLIWFISSLSPHNLWKAREAIRQERSRVREETIEEKKKELLMNRVKMWLGDDLGGWYASQADIEKVLKLKEV